MLEDGCGQGSLSLEVRKKRPLRLMSVSLEEKKTLEVKGGRIAALEAKGQGLRTE